MSIDITTIDDEEEWNRYVERSNETTPLHRYGALDVQADYADATLYRFAGFKGQEAVGIFPVFEIRKGPVSTAFSPPPDIRIPYLGPAVLNVDKLKRRKRDRRVKRFVEGCLDRIEGEIGPKYTHFRTDSRFEDVARREAYFEGPHVDRAVDVVTVPAAFDHFISARLAGSQFGEPTEPWNHKRDGIVAVAGEGVDEAALDGAHLYDVAPTVLATMDVPAAERMDGTVLPAVDPVGVRSYPDYDRRTAATEDGAVEDRLANLGYIE